MNSDEMLMDKPKNKPESFYYVKVQSEYMDVIKSKYESISENNSLVINMYLKDVILRENASKLEHQDTLQHIEEELGVLKQLAGLLLKQLIYLNIQNQLELCGVFLQEMRGEMQSQNNPGVAVNHPTTTNEP